MYRTMGGYIRILEIEPTRQREGNQRYCYLFSFRELNCSDTLSQFGNFADAVDCPTVKEPKSLRRI